MPDTIQMRFRSGKRAVPWKGLAAAAGVVACASPAITDSLHPGFFAGLLITGAAVNTAWGLPAAPLAARFQYSLLDEPELVRFYPPVRADATDPDLLAGSLFEQLQVVGGQLVTGQILTRMKNSVRWLLGAELPADVLEKIRRDPGGLGTLSGGMATRALWMGDGFWNDYLAGFDRILLGHSYFYEWLADPGRQIQLLLTPGR